MAVNTGSMDCADDAPLWRRRLRTKTPYGAHHVNEVETDHPTLHEADGQWPTDPDEEVDIGDVNWDDLAVSAAGYGYETAGLEASLRAEMDSLASLHVYDEVLACSLPADVCDRHDYGAGAPREM